jgi:ketosteroid isomerase-like protein
MPLLGRELAKRALFWLRSSRVTGERGIKAGGHIDFIKPLTLYYTGDLAYCAGTYQATNAGVTVDGRILIVLRKVNGKWLMAAHETVVRDQPL